MRAVPLASVDEFRSQNPTGAQELAIGIDSFVHQREAVARLQVDCRVPPGLGEEAVWRRIAHVLGAEANPT